MHHRHLLTLIVAAAGFLLVAVWVSDTDDSGPGDDLIGAALIEDADSRLAEADRITIESPDATVQLRLVEGEWRVASKASYPVDANTFRTFWRGLGGAVRAEPKTANRELFPRMDLGEAAKRLTIHSGGTLLLEIELGKYEAGRNGGEGRSYVYLEEDERAWLVSGLPEVSADPLDWIDKEISSFSRARIQSVTVTPADGNSFTISRASADQTNFALADLAEGEELASQTTVNAMANALSYISLEDLVAESELSGAPVANLRYDMFDGLSVSVELLQPEGDAGGSWITLSASYDGERMNAEEAPEVAEDVPPDGAVEAAELNRAWSGWLFKLAQFKADDMSKTRSDLVRPLEDEEGGDGDG